MAVWPRQLALVTGYPLDAPVETNEVRPQKVLSLVAINETTGAIFDCTTNPLTTDPACHPMTAPKQQSVTFCKVRRCTLRGAGPPG